MIAELVPEANVAFAHGQMKEHRTGKDHVRFHQRGDRCAGVHDDHRDGPGYFQCQHHDHSRCGPVWACPSSISSAGRVGRSNRTAYAFLMYTQGQDAERSGGEASVMRSGNLRSLAAASRSPCGIWRSGEPEICWERSSTATWRRSAMISTVRCSMRR